MTVGPSPAQDHPGGLASGDLYRFADWPNPEVPNGRAGVYTIWDGETLIYVGMAGRSMVATAGERQEVRGRQSGLRGRLHSHASGGDQFCVYVADRLVLPTLTPEDIKAIGAGSLKLDALVRDYIRKRLAYRYVVTVGGVEAGGLERQVQRGALGQHPLLNPLTQGTG